MRRDGELDDSSTGRDPFVAAGGQRPADLPVEAPPAMLADAVRTETLHSRLLWSGRPLAGAYARHHWPWISIPVTAFSIVWTWAAATGMGKSGHPAPWFFVLWGCMFIAAGLGLMCSPLYRLWKARRVFYAVTEHGALIFERAPWLRVHSFDRSGVAGFERVTRGRSGDVIFQRRIERRGRGTRVTEVGFIAVRDYAAAEQALRRMIDGATPASPEPADSSGLRQ
jgi:hypothetical protein